MATISKVDDVDIHDVTMDGEEGTRLDFRGPTPYSIWVPRHMVGRLSEKLHDHINKGGTGDDS
jgi:hypothetical protein